MKSVYCKNTRNILSVAPRNQVQRVKDLVARLSDFNTHQTWPFITQNNWPGQCAVFL